MKFKLLVLLLCIYVSTSYSQKLIASLVPDKPSMAPDYFCTWNLQGYVANYKSTLLTRQELVESNIFGDGKYEGWGNMFARLHRDLYLVLDDDWETPQNGDEDNYGSLIVDDTRFPSVQGLSPEQKLISLSKKTKDLGWKGLGLWICAQQAPKYQTSDTAAYWRERLKWMKNAGISYWKVDWGKEAQSEVWRSSLTKLGKQVAPGLIIEQAMTPSVMTTAKVYRTYDVENIIAVPHTIDRIGKLLTALPKGKGVSIINCEDEPYIAVGSGCAIGIMRHEFNGNLPDGSQDYVFPPVGRDLKSRLDEVTRAVMWHRIALPFGIDKSDFYVDTTLLHDHWLMKKRESWMNNHGEGYINKWQAPAIITRGLEKPVVKLKKGDSILPYILASKYPNGAIAIAAIGRTLGREYITPRAKVILKVSNGNQPIGIFGRFESLTLQFDHEIAYKKILAQDLAGTEPKDITQQVIRKGNSITLPGDLIDRIGLSAATKGDKSEPGMVLIFRSTSPYSRSKVISAITFDKSTLSKSAPGSDQFGYTTAKDGNIYVAWGDGGGFGGTNTLGRVSLGLGRIDGIPPGWTGYNIWGGVNPESPQPSIPGKSSNGIIAFNGKLYLYVIEQGVWTNNKLWRSNDLGKTWSNLGPMFNESNRAFSEPGVLQFGADNTDARDNYIYGYSPDEFADGLGLFRIDKSKIENRASYEFFSGFDKNGNPTWSRDIKDEAPVFSDPAGTEWGTTATYSPSLNRYLLTVRHNGETGEWGLFDAPEPWGPWTTVGYGDDFPTWTYSPDSQGASADRPAYIHNFPIKWMSNDGKILWHISDRGDQLNICKATLTLSKQRETTNKTTE